MSFNKQLTRLQHLDHLIRMHCTANAGELAEKLQTSQSSLFLLLQTAKELGAEVCFNHYRSTYEYEKPMRFVCGYEARLNMERLRQESFWIIRLLFPLFNTTNTPKPKTGLYVRIFPFRILQVSIYREEIQGGDPVLEKLLEYLKNKDNTTRTQN